MTTIFGLVRQHGGFVHVYSEPGIGTTVKTYFPVSAGSLQQTEKPERIIAPSGAGMILIVEDNEALRRSAARNLESFGYLVIATSDGEQALARLVERGGEIDLVFTDVVMPKMGGVELYRKVREKGNMVPFVFTTGYGGDALNELKSSDSTPLVVRKPWVREELASALRDALAQQPVETP
jgi:CheY-like chemotaxis protein